MIAEALIEICRNRINSVSSDIIDNEVLILFDNASSTCLKLIKPQRFRWYISNAESQDMHPIEHEEAAVQIQTFMHKKVDFYCTHRNQIFYKFEPRAKV